MNRHAWRYAWAFAGMAAMIQLTGCGGGSGNGSSAGSLMTTSAATGSMTVSVRIANSALPIGTGTGKGTVSSSRPLTSSRPRESLLLLSATTATVHVFSQGTTVDLVTPVTLTLSGQQQVTATFTGVPLGTVIADVFLLNSAGDAIGQGTSAPVNIVANTTAATTANAQVTVQPTGGISTVMVASQGSPQLALFALTPDLVPVKGFSSPSLGTAIPTSVVVSPVPFGTNGENTLFYVALNNHTIVPVSVTAAGVATALAAFTANGNVTAMEANTDSNSNPVLYAVTDATANNVLPIATNSDGSLGSPLTTATVGSDGNTPDGVLVLFSTDGLDNSFIYVISNGSGGDVDNVNAFAMDHSSNINPAVQAQVALPNAPVAITFPTGQNPALYVVTDTTEENVQSLSVVSDSGGADVTTLTPLNTASVGGLNNTPTAATVITVAGNNFLYAATNGSSGNITPVPLSSSDGSLGTPLTAATAGSESAGTPVAASADFTGSVPFLFVATNGTLQNFSQFPLSSAGALGTPITATAGSTPVAAAGL